VTINLLYTRLTEQRAPASGRRRRAKRPSDSLTLAVPGGHRWIATFALLCVAGSTASAQFQVVGPAPVSATAARREIRTLLEKADPDNVQQTVKKLSGLTPWYRDMLDEELIAAWRRDERANLAPVIEPLADPRVAAGIVEFSWREQRQTAFTPEYAPMLGRLMERYPDSAKPFLDDLLGSIAPGQHALDLSPPQVEAVCRILLDMPDVRTWKRNALQILVHYRQDAINLLRKDLQGDDTDRRDRAPRWLADLAPATPGATAPAGVNSAGSRVSQPSLQSKAEPSYTEVARKLRVQDVVALQVAVAADGTPRSFKVVKSVGYGLDEKAIEALRQWRFNPGMRDGKAVAVLATIEVNFRLFNVNKGNLWYSGALAFAPASGLTPPVVEDGTMPKADKEATDESVVLEFTVNQSGSVNNIHAIHGSGASAELLSRSLATWRFQPATTGTGPVEATGRVRFFKGRGDDDSKLRLSPPAQGQPAGNPGAAVYAPGNGVSTPTLIRKVEAEYTPAARAAGIKGVVALRIVVTASGDVADTKVVTSLGSGLDEKAIEAVTQWKFRPGYKDGKLVAVAMTVEISFVLQ